MLEAVSLCEDFYLIFVNLDLQYFIFLWLRKGNIDVLLKSKVNAINRCFFNPPRTVGYYNNKVVGMLLAFVLNEECACVGCSTLVWIVMILSVNMQ